MAIQLQKCAAEKYARPPKAKFEQGTCMKVFDLESFMEGMGSIESPPRAYVRYGLVLTIDERGRSQ